LIALLFALLVWLAREQQPPVAQPTARKPYPTRPPHRSPKRATVIHNAPAGADGKSEREAAFEAETERLDREAKLAGRATFARHSAARPFTMPKGAWQHDG
jgi:hypothetical protein